MSARTRLHPHGLPLLVLLLALLCGSTDAFLFGRPRLDPSSTPAAGHRHGGTRPFPSAAPVWTAATTTTAGDGDASRPPWTRFDPEKAIKLAAFSFAAYGDPTGSRWMRMPDGTLLGFQVSRQDESAVIWTQAAG